MIRTTLTLVLVLAALGFGCSAPGPSPAPPADADPILITTSSVGCLKWDAPVEAVHQQCAVVADTTIYLEGMPQRALRVDVGGDTVLAEIVHDRVWRISVLDPGPVTADSLQVGTPLSRLATYPGARLSAGEGQYYLMTPAHCGLSFAIEGLPLGAVRWDMEELDAMPDSVRVERIGVTGPC